MQAHGLLKKGEGFRVEEHVEGCDYRVLTNGNQTISVLQRIPAHVIGDGASTISALINEKNQARKKNPRYANSLIKEKDPSTELWLKKNGLTLESVPALGEKVTLSGTANVSMGGECYEVLAETDPSILEFANSVHLAIDGLSHCGVDILLEDHKKSLSCQTYAVCEVNSHSELAMHCFPSKGTPINAVEAVFLRNVKRSGIRLAPKQDFSKISVSAEVTHNGDLFTQWVDLFSQKLNLKITETRIEGSRVKFAVEGETPSISAISAKAISPHPRIAVESIITVPEA